MEPLEVIEQVVRATDEHGLLAPEVEQDRNRAVLGLGDYGLPQTLVTIEVYLRVTEAVRLQRPRSELALRADSLPEAQ